MTTRAKETGFIDRFFGPGNDIALADLPVEARAWLMPWIDDLESAEDRCVALPRRTHGRLYWYVLAFSGSQFRSLREDLMAFIGPSYSDFSGQPATLDGSDPVEASVLDLSGGLAFRFEVAPASEPFATREALALMHTIWETRPSRTLALPRPIGRVLREFNMTLQAGDATASATVLEELRGIGRLTASNLVFLKIQRLEALAEWRELLDLPELSTILSLRRPNAVTEAILKALYRTYFGRDVLETEPEALVNRFREQLLPRYGALFKAWTGMRSPETVLLFGMFALAAQPQRLGLLAELRRSQLAPEVREQLEQLAGDLSGAVTSGPDAKRDVLAAVSHGAIDEAYRLLVDLPVDAEVAALLLRCAYELATLESARRALSAVASLPSEERDSLLQQRTHRVWWEALSPGDAREAANLKEPPGSWVDWLSRVDAEGPFSGAIDLVAVGSREWNVDQIADDPAQASQLATALLARRTPEAEALVRNAAPHLIAYLRQADRPLSALKQVYMSAAVLIAADDAIGASDLAVLLELVTDLLEIGATPSEYADLIGYLHDVWSLAAAPRHIDWCLDALDCLALYPPGDEVVRDRLVSYILTTFLPWRRRLNHVQVALLAELGDELGASALATPILRADYVEIDDDAAQSKALWDKLARQRIGLYTLTEAAGRHVKSVLAGLGAARVTVNSDKVGTERLRKLAEECDVLVVAVRSAKHAATDFISMHRPDDKPTLICPGKGSASMLRTLMAHVDGLPQ